MTTENDLTKFSLYHFQACPFCALTRASLKHFNLDVELRDILKNPAFRKELVKGGGKGQVPCLKIESGGHVRWLYESQDIIDYLQHHARQAH